jgi:DNA-binding phage protein
MVTKTSRFLEYMKLHLISLEQDKEAYQNKYVFDEDDDAIDYILGIDGQIEATRHLLSVATDIMNDSNERVYE